MKKRTWLSWSSGKDSAWALHLLRQSADLEVVGLVTTVNEAHARVAMHAVRVELLRAQARAADLPLRTVDIPSPCTNEQYEQAMGEAVASAVRDEVELMAFGDLFLADIRAYREAKLVGSGLTPIFPLWEAPTDQLARQMIRGGVRAIVTCVDPRQLDASFAGREFDEAFLADLPPHVDPCGERGEFHTFVYDGPMFGAPLRVEKGEIVERDGFVFADVRAMRS